MASLDDMMNEKRAHHTAFDLTKPVAIKNEVPEEEKKEEDTNKIPENVKYKQAVVVSSGPVDMSTLQDINPRDILPSRPSKPTPIEDDLYAQLDAAVEREKKNIDERIDAILDARDAEIEKMEQDKIDAMATASSSTNTSSSSITVREDDEYGYDSVESEDDEDIPIPAPRAHRTFNFDSTSDTVVERDENSTEENLTNMIDKYALNKEPSKMEDQVLNVPDNITTTSDPNSTKVKDIEHEAVVQPAIDPKPVAVETENNTTVVVHPPVEEPKHDNDIHVMGKQAATTKIANTSGEETVIREKINNNTQIIEGIDNDALFSDDDEDTTTSNNDDGTEIIETLKKEIREKTPNRRRDFDLSKFTIAKKAVSASKVMKLAIGQHQYTADWVMYSAKRPISCTGLSGPEILKLNPENTGRNRLNTFRDMYRIIYDHVYDGNKPDFEVWLKQVRFVDLPHIYFALYMATFGGSNFIHYTCPKCNKTFIKDVTFESMVKYASDEVKEKVKSILTMDSTSPSNDSYPVDLVQISDTYVFGLRTPSVWNVIMEIASLSDSFVEKYQDMIDIITYIDGIYLIDAANGQLIPIDTKPDPNDMAKTSGRKIKAYYDIIRNLSSDDFYYMRSCINKCDDNTNDVSYLIPACTCPDCATEIPANVDVSPDSMLFTRHQLAAIGNM